MGPLLKYILVGIGIYYLWKAIFGKKKPPNNNLNQDQNQVHRKTDNATKGEGEYVDYEEVD